jgi:hypothetical protein
MYREIVTPESQEITLKIPADYLHKKLEIIVFEINEGITQSRKDFTTQMAIAEDIMRENQDVLSKLAQ